MEHMISKVSVNGFTMEYLKFGSGPRDLVILSGLNIQSVILYAPAIAKQYERFAKDFTVYLFERREELPLQYSIYDMADDTAAAIKSLNINSFCLFGTSQGGMISMALASKYPERVEKLVVASTAANVDEQRFSVIGHWAALAENKDRKGVCLSVGEKVYPKDFFEKNRDAFLMMSETVTDHDMERFVVLANTINGFDIRDKVKRISCPVLAVYDDTDALFAPEVGEELSRLFSFNELSETKKFSGFGHALYDVSPDFGDVMYTFLMK